MWMTNAWKNHVMAPYGEQLSLGRMVQNIRRKNSAIKSDPGKPNIILFQKKTIAVKYYM
jgi:hypothetical protein